MEMRFGGDVDDMVLAFSMIREMEGTEKRVMGHAILVPLAAPWLMCSRLGVLTLSRSP
jgi:hypothetical protein